MTKHRLVDSRIRAMVRKLVKDTFGSKPLHIRRETGGLSNIVFTADHDDGQFIVRMNPEPDKFVVFQKEQWATARALKAGVPVPEMLKIGRDPMPHMILRKSRGEPAASNPDRMRILHQLGHYAALINSIQTHGFGESFDWADDKGPPGHNWYEFLHGELKLDHRLRTLRVRRMLADKQLARLRRALESACGRGRTAALNHGDLRLKNVIVDANAEILVILDWEHCISSLAPEWELSLALHDLTIDEKHAFLGGYGIRLRDLPGIAPAMKALNMINYVSEIERLAKARNKTELEFCKIRLNGVLDLYSL